jgi:NAD+ diphosphatase
LRRGGAARRGARRLRDLCRRLCPDAEEDCELIDLRSLAVQGLLAPGDLNLLAQGRALLNWHQRHRFCANCGQRTTLADAGYRRHCEACGASHFPRTDPVVIVAVVRNGRCLLGRQPHFLPGVYSTLAGFVEPGESLEEAARREIQEESGIRVGPIRYHASQPWPFPASLMIGLIGEAETTDVWSITTNWRTPAGSTATKSAPCSPTGTPTASRSPPPWPSPTT